MSKYFNIKRWMTLIIVGALFVTACGSEDTTIGSRLRVQRMDEELDWIRYDQQRILYLTCQIPEVSQNQACDGVVLPSEPESERPS